MKQFGKGYVFIVLVLLGMASSCAKRDFRQFDIGDTYVAHDSLHDMVICIDEVSQTSISGRWYVADSAIAEPHYFTANSGMGHMGKLFLDSMEVKAIVDMNDDTLVFEMLYEGVKRGINFTPVPLLSSAEIVANYTYRDSLYGVKCDRDVEYAKAFGFWESYPEPENRDDYLSIVLDKMNFDDLTKKELPLTMDVYYPDADSLTLRPLLMLIHGGAFFNGDKDSEAFVRWSEYFASRGYVVANINYRIGFIPVARCNVDRAGYRAVQDAYAAMCYMLRHAEQYQISPDLLFVGGSSAGGITALNLAFMRDWNRPQSTKGYLLDVFDLVYDLGDINAVNAKPNDTVSFTIKGVVNMWGAVHDTCMLGNSLSTAILSFHGDADSVVAYGHDFPFTKVKTPARNFVDSVAEVAVVVAPEYASLVRKAQKAAHVVLVPANQFLCNKMFGSQCIDEKAKELGMYSELHTKVGGGHSLHVGDDGSLSEYYQLITDTTAQFLYRQIVPYPVVIRKKNDSDFWFVIDNDDQVLSCHWEAVGGVVTQTEYDRVRVVFFADAEKRALRVYGTLKSGVPYLETYDVN